MTLCISSTVLLLLLLFLHLPTSSSFSGPTTRPNPTIVDNTPIIDPGTGKYVYQLSDNNFTEAVTADTRGEGPMFVEFYTQWCGHCKALAPVWMQLADELRGRVRVAAMDISENPLTMEQLGVTAFPTLIYVIRNRVYTFDGTKGRSLIALKHFALGGFNEVDWKDLGKPPKPRTAGGSRDPRRQPSFSMPSSPQGAPNPVAGDLEGDDDGIRLITIDSGRKSLHV